MGSGVGGLSLRAFGSFASFPLQFVSSPGHFEQGNGALPLGDPAAEPQVDRAFDVFAFDAFAFDA